MVKKKSAQIKKLIETYLKTDYVHTFPVLEITEEPISTYDGEYTIFIINYDAKNPDKDDDTFDNLIEGIRKYTNLKHGSDYWLGLKWSWNL